MRFSSSYTHTDTLNNVEFSVTSVIGSTSGRFGIGDLQIIVKLCHSYCKVCSGPASNVCTACNVGYFLSGT